MVALNQRIGALKYPTILGYQIYNKAFFCFKVVHIAFV